MNYQARIEINAAKGILKEGETYTQEEVEALLDAELLQKMIDLGHLKKIETEQKQNDPPDRRTSKRQAQNPVQPVSG